MTQLSVTKPIGNCWLSYRRVPLLVAHYIEKKKHKEGKEQSRTYEAKAAHVASEESYDSGCE